ncbi:cyclin-dependent kinase 2-interacting protein-like [Argiope bruennichi]|uniref:Cyclin-dependent kinase 2-interacting protein like n=1 Tax=Argiope bruennichi TaxID=94029 RepID=A0A8T0FRJ6_ARGBR|nr:cyclin-dependent kinase 2-interacting protein-like [Argiope bruennichi]KAF8792120.1 Cyclin-dependent kinase 2-interacting protein like [Argiope bruennichi]
MSSKKLTGNKRIIHDSVVDLYNCIQKWKFLTSDCYSTVKSICLIKQNSLHDEDQNEAEEPISSFSELENLSCELLQKLKKLEAVAEKIRQIPRKLKSVRELSDLQQSTDENFDLELSKLSIICETSTEIEQMYTKEFKMKSNIAKEICILTKESQLTFFEAYWKYEPNIDREIVDSYLKRMIFILELHSQLS